VISGTVYVCMACHTEDGSDIHPHVEESQRANVQIHEDDDAEDT
jgi:hypothetical protein